MINSAVVSHSDVTDVSVVYVFVSVSEREREREREGRERGVRRG